jgi:hypothetical protein
MSKVTVNIDDKIDISPKLAHNISVGTYFMGKISGNTTQLYLRIYNGIISISNPNITFLWLRDERGPYRVYEYKEVDVDINVSVKEVK